MTVTDAPKQGPESKYLKGLKPPPKPRALRVSHCEDFEMLQEVLQIAKVLADGPGRQADLCLDSGGFSRFAQFFALCAELWGRHDPHPAASAPVRRNVVGVLPQLTDVKLRDLSGMLDPMFLEHCVEHPDQGYRVAPGVASARLRGTKER